MAKVGFWLKGARGKFAGAVLQKGENGTISRENVTPANPRTRKQMIQRTVVKTVSAAGAQMKQLISESFEGLSPKEAVRQFQRENITILRQNLADDIANSRTGNSLTAFFLPKQVSKVIVPNSYKISEGSITRAVGPFVRGAEYGGDAVPVPCIGIQGLIPCEVVKESDAVVAFDINVGDFMKFAFGITDKTQQLNLVTIGTSDYNDAMYGDINVIAGAIVKQYMAVYRFVPKQTLDATQTITIPVTSSNNRYKIKDSAVELIMNTCFDSQRTEVTALRNYLTALNNTGLNLYEGEGDEGEIEINTDGTENNNMLPVFGDISENIESTSYFGVCKAAAVFLSKSTGEVESATLTLGRPDTAEEKIENFGLDIETALASWEKSNLDFGGEGNFLEQGGEADTLPA